MTVRKIEKVDTVRLIDERREAFKQLDGFQKHHRVPTSGSDSDHRFLAEITARELDADLQTIFAALRKSYGLKRKEISVDGPADGGGVIATDFFNYEIHVALDDDDPSRIVWCRSITEISEPARVFAGPFEQVFGKRFSVLEISTEQSLDLESIVDHIEDQELETVGVDYDKDLEWCEIQLVDSATSVMIRQDSIRVISRREVSPAELIESFLEIQRQFITSFKLAGIPFLADPD